MNKCFSLMDVGSKYIKVILIEPGPITANIRIIFLIILRKKLLNL